MTRGTFKRISYLNESAFVPRRWSYFRHRLPKRRSHEFAVTTDQTRTGQRSKEETHWQGEAKQPEQCKALLSSELRRVLRHKNDKVESEEGEAARRQLREAEQQIYARQLASEGTQPVRISCSNVLSCRCPGVLLASEVVAVCWSAGRHRQI